ncbi:branched-chain amino acid ABC transporter permease [Candidatus Woesearchaeota archaeon]|nr:branched-chain amino acid ABC transporter permease [Candidatus Woesearchaeota archaeon]
MPLLDILPQLIVNGLIAGSIYALAASGFSLIYYVVKFQYFSHGAIMSIGAYLFFTFMNLMGLNYILAGILTVIGCVIATLLSNWLLYLPLRKRKATPAIILIASIVLLIFSSSLMLAFFGSSTKAISLAKHNKTFDFGIFTITLVQTAIIVSALILFLFLWIILKKTKLGKSMRALADNKDVAQVVGINPEKIYNYTFIIAAVLGAFGGILLGLEQNLYPRMGVPIIIKGFISSVVGGLGSVPGSIIGGLFIGLAENVGVLYLPTGYKDVISFSVLLLFLLFRPQGILGVKMRNV